MQTIALRGNESITTILSLVEESSDPDVLLFVPKGCEALERNEVNLRLLRRWADDPEADDPVVDDPAAAGADDR